MSPLTLILHIFLGSTLAGSAVIAVLVLGFASWTAMLIAAVAGFVAAFPVSFMVARKLEG